MAGMKGLKKQRRIQVILLAFVALAAATAANSVRALSEMKINPSARSTAWRVPRWQAMRFSSVVKSGTVQKATS